MSAAHKLPEFPSSLFPEFEPKPRPPSGELKALGALSQLAPGVWVSGMPAFDTPSHVLCRLVPGDIPGTFTLEPDGPYPGYVRMTDDIGKRLGVIGLNETLMRRLLWGKLVDHVRLAPGSIFISIESLLEHFKRTANDGANEKSWWTPERIARWRETYEPVNSLEE